MYNVYNHDNDGVYIIIYIMMTMMMYISLYIIIYHYIYNPDNRGCCGTGQVASGLCKADGHTRGAVRKR